MKTGRSLQDWAKEIERRANAKRDFMVDTRSMAYWRSRCIAYEKMLVERSRKAGAEK